MRKVPGEAGIYEKSEGFFAVLQKKDGAIKSNACESIEESGD